ncbi:MAG: hypothetical protein ABIV28_09215 [Longimicrobiales bacterium]
MKTMSRTLMAAAFALALPIGLSAQTTPAASAEKLEVGKWTGTVTPPEGTTINLTFDVTVPNDSMKIDMTLTEMSASAALTDIKLEGKKLSFAFTIFDTHVTCALEKKDDGTFAGPCADAGGAGGPMTMTPPKKGAPPQ